MCIPPASADTVAEKIDDQQKKQTKRGRNAEGIADVAGWGKGMSAASGDDAAGAGSRVVDDLCVDDLCVLDDCGGDGCTHCRGN